jgi:hypothetical protein
MRKSFKYEGLRAILAFDNWPAVLFARLFDRGTGFVVYRKRGFDILIDHGGGDENGTRSCIATDMYRRYLPHFDLPRLFLLAGLSSAVILVGAGLMFGFEAHFSEESLGLLSYGGLSAVFVSLWAFSRFEEDFRIE